MNSEGRSPSGSRTESDDDHEFQEERIVGDTAVESVLYHAISYWGELRIFSIL